MVACRVLQVPRSRFYYGAARRPSRRAVAEAVSLPAIAWVQADSQGTYGAQGPRAADMRPRIGHRPQTRRQTDARSGQRRCVTAAKAGTERLLRYTVTSSSATSPLPGPTGAVSPMSRNTACVTGVSIATPWWTRSAATPSAGQSLTTCAQNSQPPLCR